MTLQVHRLPSAEADLLDIWLFVARDNQSAADRLLDRIGDRLRSLAVHPEIGEARPDIATGVRVLHIGAYVALYRIGQQAVEVVRVVHGARLLNELR